MKKKVNRLLEIEKVNKQTLQDYLEQQLFLLENIVKVNNVNTVKFIRELDRTNLSINNFINNDSNYIVSEDVINVKNGFVSRDGIKRYELMLSKQPLENKYIELLPKKGNVVLIGKTDEIDLWIKSHDLTALKMKNDFKETDYSQIMKKNIDGVIGIASKNYTEGEAIDFVKSLFLAAKYFSERVKCSKKKLFFGGITFLGGKLGFESKQNVFVQGCISGLCKTLALEWEDKAVVRYIDCSPENSYSDALLTLQEEMEYGNEVEVGIEKDGTRNTIKLIEKYEEDSPKADNQPNINDVFLVSGGARGVTFECIKRLAQKYHCKFILLGRTKPEKEESCLKEAVTKDELMKAIYENCKKTGIKIDPTELREKVKKIMAIREVNRNLSELKEFAADVIYEVCDVRDIDKLKQIVRKDEGKIGKITGIIHGAGVLADKLVEKKTVEDWDKVFCIKYVGINNIISIADENKIKYIILFSSIAGCFGNIGQVDYSSANEYLNLFAKHWKVKHPDCNVVSINWGAWDAGMVSMDLRKAMKERGVKLIPIDVGTQYFLEIFEKKHNNNLCQVVINYRDRWG